VYRVQKAPIIRENPENGRSGQKLQLLHFAFMFFTLFVRNEALPPVKAVRGGALTGSLARGVRENPDRIRENPNHESQGFP